MQTAAPVLSRHGQSVGPLPARARHTAGPVVALRPQGRLEGSRGRVFRRTVAVLSALPDAQVEVDLTAVPEMDAASIHALTYAARRLGRDGGRLRLVGVRRQLRDPLAAVDPDGATVPATLPAAA